jgi:hypothetical protein
MICLAITQFPREFDPIVPMGFLYIWSLLMDIKIIVAAHKFYMMPRDKMYVPVHVGAAGKKSIRRSFLRDDGNDYEGNPLGDGAGARDNISNKNGSYCELTGLYYAWKHMDYEYLGLAHYRRHFSAVPFPIRWMVSQVQLGGKDGLDTNSNPHLARVLRLCLSKKKAEKIFQNYDVIVPSKRRYVIESLYSHYDHTLDGEHLDLAKQVIQENYKEYIPYVEKVYDRTWGYMFNMFVMPKDLVDEYCQWLFTILGKLELLIDTTDMTGFEARLFGRVSEILYNVWLQKKIEEDGIRVKEVPLLSTEPVNWWKKGTAFLRAKFGGEKYTKSF